MWYFTFVTLTMLFVIWNFALSLKNMHIIKLRYLMWLVLTLCAGLLMEAEKKWSLYKETVLQKLLSVFCFSVFLARTFCTATFWVGQCRVLSFDRSKRKENINKFEYSLQFVKKTKKTNSCLFRFDRKMARTMWTQLQRLRLNHEPKSKY